MQNTSELTLATVAAPPRPAVSARTRRLLDGPVLPTLLRLALPNVVVVAVQALSGAVDAYFLGRLGPDVLAGVALVFPVWMLMVTMSNGGVGGGISSAVARALGGGRRDDADALVLHSLVLAAGLGTVFSAGALLGGPALYRAMGGSGAALDAAVAYSTVAFAGALLVWMLAALASVLRGSGEMVVPARVIVLGEVVHVGLAPLLIFGLGPVPAMGVVGAALALVGSYALRLLALGGFVLTGRSAVRLPAGRPRLRARPVREILRVALPGSLNTLLTNGNVMAVTSLVSPAGVHALAGYGLASRLEYLQIPVVFGFGTALVTMVGTSVGAGDAARARRVAWTGGGVAAAVTGTVGLAAAVFPGAWLGLFTDDPRVVAGGAAYLRVVGLTFGFFGLGLALYFAAQGAGRMGWALAAGAGRVAVGAGGGWVAVTWLGLGVEWLFAAVALAFVGYGLAQGLAVGRMTNTPGGASMTIAKPVALVTGASSGIGKAASLALVGAGFEVVGTSRNAPGLTAPRGVTFLDLDVTSDESVSAVVRRVIERFGRLDVLVNNAGTGAAGAAEESSVAQAQRVFDINFFGLIRVTRAVLPQMRAQGRGRIINISSVLGLVPGPYMALYAATKHAIEGYSESVDHEVREHGVRVLLVEPAYTKTGFDANALQPDAPLPIYAVQRRVFDRVLAGAMEGGDDPATVAKSIVAAATDAKPKLRYAAGSRARRVSALRRFVPAWVFDRQIRKLNRLPA